jgi:hypothetical protein
VTSILLLTMGLSATVGGSLNIEAAVTVLVFAPTLVAAILARPDAHEVAGKLLRRVRLTLAIIAFVPVLAAALIGTAMPLGLSGSFTLAFGLLGVGFAFLYLRRLRHELHTTPLQDPDEAVIKQELSRLPSEFSVIQPTEGERLRLNTGVDIKVTDDALARAAWEFADRAGWRLEGR